MWDIKILNIEIYFLFYNFIIYSFLGWVYESCYVSIRKRKWVNRGFLNGQAVPLYGTGATLIYMLLVSYKGQYITVYIGGVLIATSLELATAYIMDKLFHAKWWDYSNQKFNYKGRICLTASLFWGFLALLVIELIQPLMERLINRIPRKSGEYIGVGILILFLADLTITVISTVNLDKTLTSMQLLRNELSEYMENSKLYETKEELKIKLEKYHLSELFEQIKERLESQKQNIGKSSMSEDIENRIQTFKLRYQKYSKKTPYIQKRLINAFPNLKTMNREDALEELKNKIQKRREEKKDDKNKK